MYFINTNMAEQVSKGWFEALVYKSILDHPSMHETNSFIME